MISVDIIGVDDLLRDFEGTKEQAAQAIKNAVTITAMSLEKDAKSRLSGLLGSAKHRIYSVLYTSLRRMKQYETDMYEAVVGTDCQYAPYIEFGTGEKVFQNFDFDSKAKETAALYKGKGIRKVNIRGDSFLNFAAVKNEKTFIENLEKQLDKIK